MFFSGNFDIGGVAYLLDCIMQPCDTDSVQWQWYMGRLCMLQRLVDEHRTLFVIPHEQKDDVQVQ